MNDLLSLDHSGPSTPDVKPSASSNDLLNFGLFSDPVPTHQAPDSFQMNDLSNSLLQIQSTNDPFLNSEVKNESPKSTKGLHYHKDPFVFSDPVPTHQAPDPFQMNDLSNSLLQIQSTNDPFQNSEVKNEAPKSTKDLYYHKHPFMMTDPPYTSFINRPRMPMMTQKMYKLYQFNQQAYNANMYGNMMNQQMGGFNRPFPSNMIQSHVGNTMGQNVMGNITPWSANQNMSGGMAQQQQLRANGNVSMNFNMNSGMNSMGHTMNNQFYDKLF